MIFGYMRHHWILFEEEYYRLGARKRIKVPSCHITSCTLRTCHVHQLFRQERSTHVHRLHFSSIHFLHDHKCWFKLKLTFLGGFWDSTRKILGTFFINVFLLLTFNRALHLLTNNSAEKTRVKWLIPKYKDMCGTSRALWEDNNLHGHSTISADIFC